MCTTDKVKLKIAWIDDEPNWAYDILAKSLALYLPEYNHKICYTKATPREIIELAVEQSDIVVYMVPTLLDRYDRRDRTVVFLDGYRAFEVNENGFNHALTKASAVVTTNAQLTTKAVQTGASVYWIPNGMKLPPKRLPKRHTPFVVGFAGNVSKHTHAEYKGINILKDAIALHKDGDVVLQLATYGDKQLLPGNMGSCFYERIDCLVSLSQNEGCSNVIMEAMSYSVPVIQTRVGFHGDMCIPGFNNAPVVRDAGVVAGAIDRLRTDKGFYNSLSRGGRAFAEQHHNIAKVAEEYRGMFNAILQ